MFVPVMSAGIRSGVNWIRLNEQSMTSAIVRTSIVLPRPGTPSSSTWLFASRPVMVCRISSRWPTMTFPTSRSIAAARSANASGARCGAADSGVDVLAMAASVDRGRGLVARVERAEVVANEVAQGQGHVATVERRHREVVVVTEDLAVRDVRARIDAGTLLVALRHLAVATGAGDERRVAGSPEAVEVGEDVSEVAAELRW